MATYSKECLQLLKDGLANIHGAYVTASEANTVVSSSTVRLTAQGITGSPVLLDFQSSELQTFLKELAEQGVGSTRTYQETAQFQFVYGTRSHRPILRLYLDSDSFCHSSRILGRCRKPRDVMWCQGEFQAIVAYKPLTG